MIATTPVAPESLDASFATHPTIGEEAIPTIRILIIEDNEDNRRGLIRLMELKIAERITLAKVIMLEASTMSEGLRHAADANCTILDLTLPDSGPKETLLSIKLFRPPVVIVTGDDDPLVSADCIEQGAEHVFVKGQTHGLCNAVLDCIAKDLFRLNGRLTPHGDATK